MTRRLRRIRNARSRHRAMVKRIFSSILPGVVRQAVVNAVTSVLEQDLGRPLTEQERGWLQEIAERPRVAKLALHAPPLRSSWEIGAQVGDRRHRAAPAGMMEGPQP